MKNWQPSLVGYLIVRAQILSYDANEYEWNATQHNYQLSADKAIATTYHATPYTIGYVTHDEFIKLVIDVQPPWLNRARNNDWFLTDV